MRNVRKATREAAMGIYSNPARTPSDSAHASQICLPSPHMASPTPPWAWLLWPYLESQAPAGELGLAWMSLNLSRRGCPLILVAGLLLARRPLSAHCPDVLVGDCRLCSVGSPHGIGGGCMLVGELE